MRLRLGTVEHDVTTRALVMGALGATATAAPTLDAVLARAAQLVGEGVDLLDLGGLVPPGAAEEEEVERVATAVQALRARFDVPLAVDTRRPQVLAAACSAGAAVAGDSRGAADDDLLAAASRAGATLVATCGRLPPPPAGAPPPDVVAVVRASLQEQVARARSAGIPADRVVVDAGLDLGGKAPAQSLALLRESAALADVGPPLLLRASNSRYLGILLGLDGDERRAATHAAAALGIARGCRIVRAVDGRGARRVADLLDALLTARLAQVDREVAASDA